MDYRNQFTTLSKACRVPHPAFADLNVAMSMKADTIIFEGQLVTRKRIILTTVGCGLGTCVMCPFPAESDQQVTAENLIQQFDSAFTTDRLDDYQMITVFCNGNFFNDHEIAPRVVDHILTAVGNSQAQALTVESLPQFITTKKLLRAQKQLGTKKLQIFMGLQSADDYIRTTAVNTTCSKGAFERVVAQMLALNFSPAVFILIKAPFLTEAEGITDVLKTLQYLDNLGVTNSTLCPMRIAKHTLLEKIYQAGYYQPLHLWSVIEILAIYQKYGQGTPMVNTTELKEMVNEDSICARGIKAERNYIITSLEKYLYTRDVEILNTLYHTCPLTLADYHRTHHTELLSTTIEERIKAFIYETESGSLMENKPR